MCLQAWIIPCWRRPVKKYSISGLSTRWKKLHWIEQSNRKAKLTAPEKELSALLRMEENPIEAFGKRKYNTCRKMSNRGDL